MNKVLEKLININENNEDFDGLLQIIKNTKNINELSTNGDTFPFLYIIENMPYAINGSFYDIKKEKFIDGLDINNKNQDGKTALMALAEKGFYSDIKKMINSGADWTAKDKKGRTAKDYAYDFGMGTDEEGNENDARAYFYLKRLEDDK
jgi:ankyrin repeat protein